MNTHNLSPILQAAAAESPDRRGMSRTAQSMEPSEILTIAYDVRDRISQGADILNLTVGDFSPAEFPLLPELRETVKSAFDQGEVNYPPAPGVAELRQAVCYLYKNRLGLEYPEDSVLIAGGARPLIAGTYLSLINPGEQVVYGIPSWNNDHYCRMTMAEAIELPTDASTNFFPSLDDLSAFLPTARLLALNTPQNPTGTVLRADTLRAITEMVVEENQRRKAIGQRALYVLFDHIYWLLTFDEVEHVTPVQLVPESAPYVIHVDGLSKGFAATGLRVGWGVGPIDLVKKMVPVLTHIGTWAPRPEQVATAKILQNDTVLDRHISEIRDAVGTRLNKLSNAIKRVKEITQLPIEAIAPEGAIYLSVYFNLRGKVRPDGKAINNDEDIRVFLLDAAGLALVPFRAFGAPNAHGWFRASVGTVSPEQCESIEQRLLRALQQLS